MNTFKQRSLALLTAATLLTSSSFIVAEENFDKEVEYRQGVMRILSWNMKNLGGMLKGKIPYDAEEIKVHANDINSVASMNIIAGFPEDSVTEESAALEDIWMDQEDFEKKLEIFKKAAANMQAAAQSGSKDAVGAAMKDLGASCKGCHKKYKN